MCVVFKALGLTLLASYGAVAVRQADPESYRHACLQIKDALPDGASAVHWPFFNVSAYDQDIFHAASSSTRNSACSVRPGSADDVGRILQVLGSTRTPFAVKGGGHATNPTFSSTPGVEIAMSRFNQVVYDEATQTAEVGAGLVWDDVYGALEPLGVNAVGGRVSGVGVAGLLLGGGYSFKTNQYGLALDNVVGYELVLPNGTVASVTKDSYPELLFGLRGGYNNFGIVTKFTLKTHPQAHHVWGGVTFVDSAYYENVTAAAAKFAATVTDPKAAILVSYLNQINGTSGATLVTFYDAPTPPQGMFDELLAIPPASRNVSTRSLLSLVQVPIAPTLQGTRGFYHALAVQSHSTAYLRAIANETTFWATHLAATVPGLYVQYYTEPFLPSILSHAPAGSAAYPFTRATAFGPTAIYFSWTDPESDALVASSMRASAAQLERVLAMDGQRAGDTPLYGNYALFGTPRERIFGNGEAWARLRALRAKYDPERVMALAGGWKVE